MAISKNKKKEQKKQLGRDPINESGQLIVAVSRPLSLVRSGYTRYFGSQFQMKFTQHL